MNAGVRLCTRTPPHTSRAAPLIPLFLIIGSGGVGAGLYLLRLATVNPDVCWDKKNNPEPWNKLSPTDQYKFYSVNVDYSKLKKDRPDF
ncbi:NDUFA4, mitochondrial complex associated [Columba livia]|uniref:Cytochrome c oxidase subunit NDUFA4 n=1 Tax=Columba livia TaxID=8932 RepID=A0A2I0MQ75_COLLI|nr:cytochrome c oxidase subunit NDUFA4 [Columba livia]PKK31797.1 NDUFA4, mitochondrial complex associated [Columba livia]